MNAAKNFNWLGWLVLAALVLVWEYSARAHPKFGGYLPPASQVGSALADLIASGAIFAHLGATMTRFFQAYTIAALLAVSAGVLLGYFRFLRSVFATVIELLRPMPSVAIIPVALLALGIGDAMIIAVTVYASVWPILINSIEGVRAIEPTLLDTARTFGLRRWRILWRIVLPAAAPHIATGLRISLSIALILVTTAEMIAGSRGLGFFILDEERSFKTVNMYAGIAVVAALGYGLNRLFLFIEGKALRWQRGMLGRQRA
jgi:ABC-type nitrate/sulfonate/bicarbonate transport system permease component